MSRHPKTTGAITLLAHRPLRFSGVVGTKKITVSTAGLVLRCFVMNLCFFRVYDTSLKLVRSAVKQLQILLRDFHMISFVIKCGSHLADSFLISTRSCKIKTSEPCDLLMSSTIPHTCNLRSVSTISCVGYIECCFSRYNARISNGPVFDAPNILFLLCVVELFCFS